jgi:cell wall-associated NlpC family hydrolase
VKLTTRGAALALILALGGVSTASADTTGGTTVAAPDAAVTTPDPGPATPGDAAPATPDAPTTAVSATRAVSLTRTQTKQVQRKVRVRADGALGAKTRVALRRYQTQKKLTKTGRPNLETIKAMKLSFAAAVEQKLAGASARSASTATPAALAAAVEGANAQIGVPYRSAGTTPSGFDCSGLMVYVYKQAGISLPRTSFEQYKEGTSVAQADIQAGDLVFFSTAGSGASHVGIATSATTVISATTRGVMEHQINDSYWGANYVGARRIAAS